MTLLERTQILLSQRLDQARGDRGEQIRMLREIAAASEDPVNFEWLKKFEAGKIENPGVNTIQALHDCLTKKSASAA